MRTIRGCLRSLVSGGVHDGATGASATDNESGRLPRVRTAPASLATPPPPSRNWRFVVVAARWAWRAVVAAACIAVVGWSGTAHANPVTARYVEDDRCDPLEDQTLPEELGTGAVFPVGERITSSFSVTRDFACLGHGTDDDAAIPNFLVSITNLTTIAWTDVFFVADHGITVGNADGKINGEDAFRIDSGGFNDNLRRESGPFPGIFMPGETWEFLVVDFAAGGAGPVFGSLGVPSDAPGSNASIVARCAFDFGQGQAQFQALDTALACSCTLPECQLAEPGIGWMVALGLAFITVARRGWKHT